MWTSFSLTVEDADNELAGFKSRFDYVYHKTSYPKVWTTTILMKYVFVFFV